MGSTSEYQDLSGGPALAMGGAWVSLAFAIHARYFWGRIEPWWRFAPLGWWLGAGGFVIGFGYAIVVTFAQFA